MKVWIVRDTDGDPDVPMKMYVNRETAFRYAKAKAAEWYDADCPPVDEDQENAYFGCYYYNGSEGDAVTVCEAQVIE